MQHIRGAGGGKNAGNHIPTEADDSLQSVQYATVLDLLSEGEIQGLDDGFKSIYLDGTPVQDASGSNNFEGYSIVTRNGTQSQLHIAALDGTETEVNVATQVTFTTSVTRQITNVNTDRLRVTLKIPSLRQVEDDGDIIGYEVRIKIEVQYNGGGYNVVKDDTIKGKSSNVYMRDYVIPFTGAFPVDVRLVRVSADDANSKTTSETWWSSYTEIIDEKFKYPNSALTYLRFDSRQFSNIPNRRYLIRGIKVKLPSNASVDTTTHIGRVTYSGVWNGTFGAATWCNDPAWCLYDLMTSTRYGASIPESTLDKWDFYAISQYCNGLVSDGKGGQEPRFSCNLLINQRKDVYNAIREMTSLFRGMSYYGAGSFTVMQDKPVDSQYLLGPSNVVDGAFEYTGTSHKARHSTVSVAYQTYDGLGEATFEYVDDPDAVAKYGIVNKEMKALGCYSQGQAHRMGLWALKSEQFLTETCTFSVSIDSGIIVRPGMVIDVADPLRGGTRRQGRIGASSTTTVINIDSGSDLSIDITKSPTLSVILPTGIVETKTISGFAPSANPPTITVSSAFSEAPNDESIYLIQTSDIQSQQYRVIAVEEAGEGVFAVTALQYNSSIYSSVDSGEDVVLRDITNLSAAPDAVTDIEGEEFLYSDGQGVFVGCDLSWQHNRKRVTGFRITYRVDNDNWATITTSSPSVSLRQGGNFGALRAGNLQVQIQAVNYLNKGSTIATFTKALSGKTAAPGDVTNFTMIPTNGLARLQWTQSADLDVVVGGLVRIRHSPALSGVTWSNASSIHSDLTGTAKEAYCDLKSGTYLAKFVDSGGRTSVNTAIVEFTKPELDNLTNINTQTEDTSFAGAKTDLVVASNELLNAADGSNWKTSGTYLFQNNPIDLGDVFNVQLDSTLKVRGFFPGNPFIDTYSNFDSISDFDGATPATCNAEIYIRTTQVASPYPINWGASTSYSVGDLRKATTDQENYIFKCVAAGTSGSSEPTWPNPEVWSPNKAITVGTRVKAIADTSNFIFECTVDGTTGIKEPSASNSPSNPWPTSLNATVVDNGVTWKAVYAVTDNNAKWVPVYPSNWTSWRPFNNAQFSARRYELKLKMVTGGDNSARLAIEQLRVASNAPTRTITGTGTSSASGNVTVTFPNKFNATPAIGITMSTTSSGDYYTIASSSGSAFTISIYNSGGTAQARSFSWTATGYGKGN